MWFWKCARGQILRQTDRHAHHNTPLPYVDGINILFSATGERYDVRCFSLMWNFVQKY